jgi:hypothetical protein
MSKRYIGGLISAFNNLKVANAPTIGCATPCNAKAYVAFTAPSCVGGAAITSYTAVSCPGSKTGTGSSSPITVNCLTNGTAYTFQVQATNVYGLSLFSASSASVTPALTFGIFTIGGNSSLVTNKYTFSCCTSVVSTSLANLSYNGRVALGNSTKAVLYGNKWTFSGCTVSSGGIPAGSINYGSGAGNSTVGVYSVGAVCTSPYNGNNCFPVSSARKKYSYAGCSVSSATNASCYNFGGSAVGTSSVGIFAIGPSNLLSPSAISTRRKYTYSGDTCTSATSASNASYAGSAIGNATAGIFALGLSPSASTTRNKYTYSGDVNATATSSTSAGSYGSATGNSTLGIFQVGSGPGGYTSTRNKYIYSGCVNTTATSSSTCASTGTVGFSTAIAGVNM